jgi:hypothetical protein
MDQKSILGVTDRGGGYASVSYCSKVQSKLFKRRDIFAACPERKRTGIRPAGFGMGENCVGFE